MLGSQTMLVKNLVSQPRVIQSSYEYVDKKWQCLQNMGNHKHGRVAAERHSLQMKRKLKK